MAEVSSDLQGTRLEESVGDGVTRIVRIGRALSDPIRVRMLLLMARGRVCCADLYVEVPAEPTDQGICVCELTEYFGLGQSKVSYHLRRLKEAELVLEEKRGKWSFYALNRPVIQDLLESLESGLLGVDGGGVGACCRRTS